MTPKHKPAHDTPTYCIVDRQEIPLDRAIRKSNTCTRECAKTLRAIQRARVDQRRCRICAKPSTPEERKAFQAFLRSHPEYKPVKRGRPAHKKEQIGHGG